jgi:hypothetical protein
VPFCNGSNRINGSFWCNCCSLVVAPCGSLKFYSKSTIMCVPNTNNFCADTVVIMELTFENDEPLFEVDITIEDPLTTYTATV